MLISEQARRYLQQFRDVPDEARKRVNIAIRKALGECSQERLGRSQSGRVRNEKRLAVIGKTASRLLAELPALNAINEAVRELRSQGFDSPSSPQPLQLQPQILPIVKCGSPLTIVEGAPFSTETTTSIDGPDVPFNGATVDPGGTISFLLDPQNGAIAVSCGLSVVFTAPASGPAVFTASPIVTFQANFWSDWFRLAAGDLVLQLFVFGPNAVIEGITLPVTVSPTNTLFTESDSDLFADVQTPGNSGVSTVQTFVCLEEGVQYGCTMFLGAGASADSEAQLGHSHMALFVQAQLPSLSLFMPTP